MKWIFHFPDDCLHLDYFVNPIPALAVIGMALNDHWWKRVYPSWLTGKISDFLGVFYFPLFFCAIVCIALNFAVRPILRKRRIAYISPALMFAGMALTAILMVAIKTSPDAALEVQTLFSSFFFPIRLTPDPTDLISFLSLPLSFLYARRFFDIRPGAS